MARGTITARLAVVNGRTRLVEHRQSAPLKIARTFEHEDGGLDICIMDASPGLLAGDCYEMEWTLEPGARARITTQGATRVHPSDGLVSMQQVRISVAEGARLEWWPESTIPFRGARFSSRVEAQLGEGAQLLLFESLSAGRVARGETFEFGSVTSELSVHDETGPRLFTRNRFAPEQLAPQGAFSWGEAKQFSNLYAFGIEFQSEQVQSLLDATSIHGGASILARGDLGVVMLGRRAHDLRCMALEIEGLLNAAVSRETP
jgi:urease accessory protein